MHRISIETLHDEFLIRATGHKSLADRDWTRSSMVVAKVIAHGAMSRLGYPLVEVFNTYGGTLSSALWVVTPEKEYDPGES